MARGSGARVKRSARDIALILIAAVFTIVCVELGVWQLRRLQERRALNARIVQRLHESPLPVRALPHDTAALHYRRVAVDGRYDYAHELVLVDRTRNGSPGVDVITPVRVAGSDTAVLVNRGWLYAPDGMTVDLRGWREGDSLSGTGYARPLERPFPGVSTLAGHPGAFRWLDTTALRARIPYPVYPVIVVLEGDTTGGESSARHIPPRVPPPPLDEGPHMSYAIQWFSFATIAVVGTIVFLRTGGSRRRRDDGLFEVRRG